MLSELFGLLSSVDVSSKGKTRVNINLNRNRIRSISAYSSNSIFYFPTIVSDQTMPEELAMCSRMIEKSYASFVVACISLMPFHRIKADDKASIEEYLAQFHQNMGMNQGSGPALNKLFGIVSEMDESAVIPVDEAVQELQDFLYGAWKRSLTENTDFIKIVSETVSLNDMYCVDAIDPKTRVLQEQYQMKMEELDTWGFLGEASDDLFDTDDDSLLDMSDEEILQAMDDEDFDDDDLDSVLLDDELDENAVKSAIDNIRFSLESVSENKILSCSSLTKLASLEAKLNKLKNKYTKYLNRYKKKYEENKKTGSKSKLVIRFNNTTISNPKAFMKQYGTYIKIINKRLKLVDKRRAELRKRKGIENTSTKLEENVITDLSQLDFDAIEYCIKTIDESLNAPDSQIFALVEAKSKYEDMTPEEFEKYMERGDKILQQARQTSRDSKKAQQNAERKAEIYRRQAYKANRASRDSDKTNELLRSQNARLMERIDDQNKTQSKPAQGKKDDGSDDTIYLGYDRSRPQSGLNVARAAGKSHTEFKTFDREVFTKMDMQKANEAIPIFTKASIGFIVDETEEVVSRDILIGIKAYIHKAPSIELINDVYNCIINKRKFLRFVKFITGEERSLSDLLFGIKELRSDALDAKSGAGEWRSAFKRRRRWAKMSIPYLTKEYTPNGTIIMTMNEVQFIKDQYGVDIMTPDHVRMIMDSDYLLGFVIIDQANEMVYVTYDGHGYGFQQYTYAMLEREQQTSDRMMRELYRSLSH